MEEQNSILSLYLSNRFMLQSVEAGHFVEEKLMFITSSSVLTFYQIATRCESTRATSNSKAQDD
jgi:hypothetical protein